MRIFWYWCSNSYLVVYFFKSNGGVFFCQILRNDLQGFWLYGVTNQVNIRQPIFCILAYGIYGGILYATAYGSEEKATKGKNTILWAIIGGVIVGLSFVLVRYFASTLLGAGDADINDNLPR